MRIATLGAPSISETINVADWASKCIGDMTAITACDRCAKTVKRNENFIECMGFCNNVVHMKCDNLNIEFITTIRERPNLFWMCDECTKLMKVTRFKSVVSSLGCAISTVIENQMTGISELKAEISKNNQQVAEVIVENNNQVAQLANIVNASTPVPAPNRERPSKRRREDTETSNAITLGTRNIASDIAVAVKPAANLFWMYLSRFHPSVKEDVVENLAREGLQTREPLKVVSLVKKGADLSSMNFISFKVGVPVELKDVALNPNTWPEGILFREFEGQSKNSVWLPPAMSTTTRDGTPFSTPAPVPTPTFDAPISITIPTTISDEA